MHISVLHTKMDLPTEKERFFESAISHYTIERQRIWRGSGLEIARLWLDQPRTSAHRYRHTSAISDSATAFKRPDPSRSLYAARPGGILARVGWDGRILSRTRLWHWQASE